jgi:macrolide transport system ATP-binding/permease protein
MSGRGIEFERVTFRYEDAPEPLFTDLTCRFPEGWTGVVGANGSGKTTLLRLATGALQPASGRIRLPGPAFYAEQRTDDAPDDLPSLLRGREPEACRLRGLLRLGEDWLERWPTLSHGERKRAQLGVLLWREPLVLGLDEPTNHLDAEGRDLLLAALRGFEGVGLLVSHDRELLDGLCERCLFLDPPDAVLRPGGYSDGAREAKRERESRERRHEIARQETARTEREAGRRVREMERARRRSSKRHLDPRDRDGRAKINLARLTGKDGAAGRRARRMRERSREAREEERRTRTRKVHETGIGLPGRRAPRDVLVRLSAGVVELGRRRLVCPELVLRPDDRVAVIGPNGGGKSSLVRRIVRSLDLPQARFVYVPQEIARERSRSILAEARALPPVALGRMMTVVSRLGSRPARLLESDTPSPGEVRKLLLAVGAAREPWLIVLDEPTNHMDLPSVECLEEALAGFPGALLLVSHDRVFLGRLTRTRWRVEGTGDAGGDYALREEEWGASLGRGPHSRLL